MMKNVSVELTGVCPLLMHNGQTADPLNNFAKELKASNGKKKKTDPDHLEIARIEFFAGLYMEGDDYIIPSENIEGMLGKASHEVLKISKAKTSGSLMVEQSFVLTEYTGSKDPKKRQIDNNCFDRRLVKIQTSRIVRVRPKFCNWKAIGEISYMDGVYDEKAVLKLLEACGKVVGIGDYRPKFGRFTVEKI
jgi:hypothetical protein